MEILEATDKSIITNETAAEEIIDWLNNAIHTTP